jgi:hypothetical protein
MDSSARHAIPQPQGQQQQLIHEYLRHKADTRPPAKLIQEFQNLLLQGRNADAQVSKALEKIIFAGESQFNSFLSQCFYTIFSVWLQQPGSMAYLDQLLSTLDVVCQAKSYDRCRKQLIQLIKNYQLTPAAEQLKLVATLILPREEISNQVSNSLVTNESTDSSGSSDSSCLNSQLTRYTYLYQHFIPQDLEILELIEQIKQLQSDRQQNFEILLSKHIIYRFRLKQLAKMKMMSKGAGKIITKVDNPSLLSDRAFQVALQQYVGKIEQNNTLLERSQRFSHENEYRSNYQVFKQDLHHFLTDNIKSRNSTYQFAKLLEQKLVDIFPRLMKNPSTKLKFSKPVGNYLAF